MLTELQQKRVWEGWLSAEIRAYYFGDLAAEYHRWQRLVTWAILFLSSGAFITLVAGLPGVLAWAPTILILLTTALSLYAIVAEYPRRASESADLHVSWSALARKYEALWESMDAEDALARLAEYGDEEDRLSKPGMALAQEGDPRLLKWQDYVEKRHQPQVAHAPV